MEASGWPKKITVDKRIVSLLSRSTYEKFPKAIRELVSNAYDADATAVSINIDLPGRQIVVEDNGVGMTPEEFDFYLRIAGQRRGKGVSLKFGRKRIGRLGVGFLAVFPFCETLEIASKAQNSDTILTAVIPTGRFVRESASVEDVGSISVEGNERSDPRERAKHYTRLTMAGVTPLVDEYFRPRSAKYGGRSRSNISSWDGAERLKWELQEVLPLDFPVGSVLGEGLGQARVGMETRLNGAQLFRNDPGGEILDNNKRETGVVGNIVFRYAISTGWKAIHPFNARGMKVRLNNVGVGERTYFDLGIRGRTWSRLHWLSGEIHILDGLDGAIALDRDSFTWSPEYEEFRDFFRERLSKQGYRIEQIAAIEKDVASLQEPGKSKRIGPKKEILDESMESLRAKGFEVVRSAMATTASEGAIKLDKRASRVTVFEDHPSLRDTISLLGETFELSYSRWKSSGSPLPACRRRDDGKLEVNLDYPLFRSGTSAEMFLKLHVILLVARERVEGKAAMFDYVVNAITREFER